MPGHLAEDPPAPVQALPAKSMGIVDVHVEIGEALEQGFETMNRSHVTGHRIDPISEIPNVSVAIRLFEQCRFQVSKIVVFDGKNRNPFGGEHPRRKMHRGVGVVVDEDGIPASHQAGERSEVCGGCR